ncbi:MAG: hypothetical protein U5L96_13040 [Owenweeksia sp.]|nr:hypothetical protein [Owenweeksia sp.]
MKKLLLIITFSLGLGSLSAQELGIRFGGVNGGGGAAIDAVFGTGPSRIHADLGFFNDAIGVDVLWDLVYRPLGGEAFNWYLGIGPSAVLGDPFFLGAAGELGLEYRFNSVPLVLGIDWRPTIWVVEETAFTAESFGLNLRYDFGS